MTKKVFIFVPAFGQQISACTFLATHALQSHFMQKGISAAISTLSFPDIAELRAMAMTIWYDTMPDTEYFLQVDADMGFPPELVTDMMLFDEPLVGTIYAQRRLPISWAGSGTGAMVTERRGGFMHVEGVGMGCTIMRREVVTKMIEKFPELIDTRLGLHPAGETMKNAGVTRLLRFYEKIDYPDRGVVSEDLSFCIRWNQCGGKVWAAIAYRINHVGPFDYSGRYLDHVEEIEARAAAEAKAAGQAAPVAATSEIANIPPGAGGTATSEAVVTVEPPMAVAAE